MKAIIVEDNHANYESLRYKIETACPQVEILSWAQTCAQAVQQINQAKPDLLFLDIQLPDGQGFDILKQIRPLRPAVIFVTGYDEHIWRAFEFSAIDYLLKPVDSEKLVEAVARAEEHNRIHVMADQHSIFEQSKNSSDQPPRIALSNQEVIIFRELSEIVYLEAKGHNTEFYFKDYFMSVHKGLGDYEELFAKYGFLSKVMRSYIVNLHEVRHFIRGESNLLMTNGKLVPLGENYRPLVLGKLREFCQEDSTRPRLELPDQKIIAYPHLDEILYFEAEGNMTAVYIKGYKRTFLVSKNIGEFVKILKNRTTFMQVHRSYILNLEEVRYFNRERSVACMNNSESVPVSEQYKDAFLNRLQ